METLPHSESIPTRLPVTSIQSAEVGGSVRVVSLLSEPGIVRGNRVTDTLSGVEPMVASTSVEAVGAGDETIEAGGSAGVVPQPTTATSTTATVQLRP